MLTINTAMVSNEIVFNVYGKFYILITEIYT